MLNIANLTAVYFKDRGIWVGFVEEIPGANSQGRTLTELKKNLAEATELIIAANRELAWSGLNQHNVRKEYFSLATT